MTKVGVIIDMLLFRSTTSFPYKCHMGFAFNKLDMGLIRAVQFSRYTLFGKTTSGVVLAVYSNSFLSFFSLKRTPARVTLPC